MGPITYPNTRGQLLYGVLKGMDSYLERWLDGEQQMEPTILAGIAFQNAGDGPKLHVMANENGMGSCGYG